VRPALIALVSLLLAGCSTVAAPGAAIPPASPAVSSASSPRIAPPPVTPPTPPGNDLPAFVCADSAGGTVGVANAIAARVAEASGYDRFVLQFDSIIPNYTVTRQAKPVFKQGASGQTVTLSGTTGVLVTVHSATGATTFTGPTDIQHPEYKVLLEARQTQDYEGFFSWGLGLSHAACMRVFILQEPARLVIDFQAD
jgi:predicted small secreted protein